MIHFGNHFQLILQKIKEFELLSEIEIKLWLEKFQVIDLELYYRMFEPYLLGIEVKLKLKNITKKILGQIPSGKFKVEILKELFLKSRILINLKTTCFRLGFDPETLLTGEPTTLIDKLINTIDPKTLFIETKDLEIRTVKINKGQLFKKVYCYDYSAYYRTKLSENFDVNIIRILPAVLVKTLYYSKYNTNHQNFNIIDNTLVLEDDGLIIKTIHPITRNYLQLIECYQDYLVDNANQISIVLTLDDELRISTTNDILPHKCELYRKYISNYLTDTISDFSHNKVSDYYFVGYENSQKKYFLVSETGIKSIERHSKTRLKPNYSFYHRDIEKITNYLSQFVT